MSPAMKSSKGSSAGVSGVGVTSVLTGSLLPGVAGCQLFSGTGAGVAGVSVLTGSIK